MKTKQYKGWTIYKVASGCRGNRLQSIKAKHPARVMTRLEAVINGSETITLAHIKRDIDAIEESGTCSPTARG